MSNQRSVGPTRRRNAGATRRPASVFAFVLRLFLRLRDSRGATTVENALVMSVALTGAVGFKELGDKVHHQYLREGAHIEGKGMPRSGTPSLAGAFDTPELACPSGLCSTPALSLPLLPASPLTGGTPASGLVSGGASPSHGAAATPPIPGAGGGSRRPPSTPAHRERFDDCEERLNATPLDFTPLTAQDASDLHISRTRPVNKQQAAALLCLEMVCECPPEKSEKECIDQWECIYNKVASARTSRYFGQMSVNVGGGCPETSTYGADNQKTKSECIDKRLTRWACYKKTPVVDEQGTPYPGVTATKEDNPEKDPGVSQTAGEEAARNFANDNFVSQGYTCDERGGSDVFDLLCVRGDDVVIIEAKGGGAGLEKRRNVDKTRYVQQGTEDYAYAIADEMRRSTNATLQTLAGPVERALDRHSARYFKVTQSFDATASARPLAPVLEEFDLANPDTVCPRCHCAGTGRSVGGP